MTTAAQEMATFPVHDPEAAVAPELRKLALQYQARLAENAQLHLDRTSAADLAGRLARELPALFAEDGLTVSPDDCVTVARLITATAVGYGPLDPLLLDPEISEIMVNGAGAVFIERGGTIFRAGCAFADDEHLVAVIQRIAEGVGRRIDESSPMVDARLPDGSRVNAVLPPLSTLPILTIRRFTTFQLGLDDFVKRGTLSEEMADFLERAVRGRLNILVSGGTGTGKTTTLDVLTDFIPPQDRIITIEDDLELHIKHENYVGLEYRPPNIEGNGEVTIRRLLRNSLRMRPDRIIVGEVRGDEALDMLQAMNTGHPGSMSTVHANSPQDSLSRLETMSLSGSIAMPLEAIRTQIASAIHVVLQQVRLGDGSRRIMEISQLMGYDQEGVPEIEPLFSMRQGPDGQISFERAGQPSDRLTGAAAFYGVKLG